MHHHLLVEWEGRHPIVVEEVTRIRIWMAMDRMVTDTSLMV